MKKTKNTKMFKEIEIMIQCTEGNGVLFTAQTHAGKAHQFSEIFGFLNEAIPQALDRLDSGFLSAIIKIKEPNFEYWILVNKSSDNRLMWSIRNHDKESANPVVRDMFKQMGELFKSRGMIRAQHLLH